MEPQIVEEDKDVGVVLGGVFEHAEVLGSAAGGSAFDEVAAAGIPRWARDSQAARSRRRR